MKIPRHKKLKGFITARIDESVIEVLKKHNVNISAIIQASLLRAALKCERDVQ